MDRPPLETYFVCGHQLEARRIPGRSDRAPIVLLHEGLGSVTHWKDFPDRLAAATGASVFIYSRHGNGFSTTLSEPRSVRYLHDEGEQVLPVLLDQAGVNRPILVGHSDGASIALLFAGRHPDRVSGLVLEAPHVIVEPEAIAGIEAAKLAYETTDLRQRLARYHADVDATFWGWSDIWLDPAFRNWNIEASLDAVRCPVLVIQGQDDEYGTLDQVARIKARLPWAETTVLPTCRHAPHRDQPELTLARIVTFLSSRNA